MEVSTSHHGRFQFVALDLDGTLLNSEHKVSHATIECIRQLESKGFGVMVATGRSLNTVYETILSLDLPRPLPVICSNGARGVMCRPVTPFAKEKYVTDSTKNMDFNSRVKWEPLFELPVPENVVRRSVTLAKELGFVSQYYVGDEIYADPISKTHHEYVEMYKLLTGAKTICVNNMIDEVLEENSLPSKLLVMFHKEEQDGAMEKFMEVLNQPEFRAEDGSPPTIVRGSFGWFLEVLHPHVNKGNGLKRMCTEHLKIETDSVVAFGDGDNDAEFLRQSGWGVAMNNARPIIKEIADEVINFTNNEDGVRRTLESMQQQGKLIFWRENNS